ncbi:UNVERIFIED_CONTAM: hypothetical protein Slati_2402500 [Sesamum latifolium]|uniref:Zinc knuckle CX2CX4HX4C domain-containing protein n=1 Tax=Sesamum latifolium TaxID=2727402 RepID=A0AAW2WBT6_9LAMI
MDMEESRRAWGASLRIRVAINVTNPLIRALRVRTTLGDALLVSFTYERLQNFCYLVMFPKSVSFILPMIFRTRGRRFLTDHGFALRLALGVRLVRGKVLLLFKISVALRPIHCEVKLCLVNLVIDRGQSHMPLVTGRGISRICKALVTRIRAVDVWERLNLLIIPLWNNVSLTGRQIFALR